MHRVHCTSLAVNQVNFGRTPLQCDAAGPLSVSQLQDVLLGLEVLITVPEFCDVCHNTGCGPCVDHKTSLLWSTDRVSVYRAHLKCKQVVLLIHRLLGLVSSPLSAVHTSVCGALTKTAPLSLSIALASSGALYVFMSLLATAVAGQSPLNLPLTLMILSPSVETVLNISVLS